MISKILFQKMLSITSYFVYLPVFFGIVGALALIVIATLDMFFMFGHLINFTLSGHYPESLHADIVSDIIGAIDLYLIAIVLVIFSFGLYELFITELSEYDKKIRLPAILEIHSLDELKDKLAKVIVMVLLVSYFKKVLYTNYTGALEMLYFAISISVLSFGVYLLRKESKKSLKAVKK